jgi:hypothetical protein
VLVQFMVERLHCLYELQDGFGNVIPCFDFEVAGGGVAPFVAGVVPLALELVPSELEEGEFGSVIAHWCALFSDFGDAGGNVFPAQAAGGADLGGTVGDFIEG